MTLKAFGSNGQDLGTSTVTVNPGAPLNQQVSVTSMSLDIASFELQGRLPDESGNSGGLVGI